MNSLLSTLLVLSVAVYLASAMVIQNSFDFDSIKPSGGFPKSPFAISDRMKEMIRASSISGGKSISTSIRKSESSSSSSSTSTHTSSSSNGTHTSSSSSNTTDILSQNDSKCGLSEENEEKKLYCLTKATRGFQNDTVCFKATYYKKTYESSEIGESDPLNGVPQCTKTPCNSTETASADCTEAFGARLADIKEAKP
ncbi:hypothetical protein CAEBREN_18991 [Caenorhabditis brenneri]|uniref:Secreted protein n=1 Tax=Caenorhabditis brenneri TaxID=135651 RepID=G0PE92_CAEBE|nr:hypothetical protein CAEBREN_18991 [Caenorhabditis brenneri]